MAHTYTYYDAAGNPESNQTEPHEGVGRVWVRGEYRSPIHPSPLDVRIGRGPQVWTIIAALKTRTPDEVIAMYAPALTVTDIDAALAFYASHKDQIDERLCEYQRVA